MKKRRLLLFFWSTVLIALSLSLVSFASAEETKKLKPIKDVTLDPGNPDMNFGGKEWLIMGKSGVDYAITLIMFDLSSIPANAMIEIASLKLYAFSVGATMRIGVHYSLNNTWPEYEITWDNALSYVTHVEKNATDIVTVAESGKWYLWDITDDVRKALHNGRLTVILVTEDPLEGGFQINFGSKENPFTSPELEITYITEKTETPLWAIVIAGFIVFGLPVIGVVLLIRFIRKRKAPPTHLEGEDTWKYCIRCGQKIPANATYCIICGKKQP